MPVPLFVCHANGGIPFVGERVLQIRLALIGDGRRMVPVSEYLELVFSVDWRSH